MSDSPKGRSSAEVEPSGAAPAPHSDDDFQYTSSEDLDDAARALVRDGVLSVWLVNSTKAPSLRIDGPCPRCKHPYSQTQGLRMLTSTVRGIRAAKPEPSTTTQYYADFLCDCDRTHSNAPDGVRGCGASYSIPSSLV